MNKKKPASRGKRVQAKNCFVCGYDNPRGLGIPYYYDGETVSATFVPGDWLSGFEKVVHGGILFSLADEAMMHLIWASGLKAISAEVTIRFRSFARTGEPLSVKAEFEERSRHLIRAKCILKDSAGRKIAAASGKFLMFSEKENKYFEKIF